MAAGIDYLYREVAFVKVGRNQKKSPNCFGLFSSCDVFYRIERLSISSCGLPMESSTLVLATPTTRTMSAVAV